MEDIAPALLEAIRKEFRKILGDAKLKQLNYLGAEEYAETVGDAMAKAFQRHISADKLPEGRMFWNIADRVIRPMLELDHRLVSDAAVEAQQALNMAAGMGLKAQRAALDEDRVIGILNKVANAEDFSTVAWMLDEPIRTFSRSVVDDVLEKNIDFQGRAGLRPKVIRTAERKCCRWCSNLAGVYEYPDIPRDVYRRHENCRCSVEYDPRDGRKQDVHSKEWTVTKKMLKLNQGKL